MKEVMRIGESLGVEPRMFVMPGMKVGPQVIWVGGNWGTMGMTSMSISILEITMELAITKVCKATRMLSPSKFPPRTFFEKRHGGIQRTFKQFRNKMHDGESKYGFSEK